MQPNNGFFIAKPDLESLLIEVQTRAPKVWIGSEFTARIGPHITYVDAYAVASAFIEVAPGFFVPIEYRDKVCEFTSIDNVKDYVVKVDDRLTEMEVQAKKHGLIIEKGVISNKPISAST